MDDEPGHVRGPDEKEQDAVQPVQQVPFSHIAAGEKGHGACQEGPQVHIADAGEGEGMDKGRSAQDEQDVEDVGADDVSF